MTGGGTVTITGLGGVDKALGDYPLSAIRGQAADSQLINVDNTIQGAGYLGYESMGLVNQSLINATEGTLAVRPNSLGLVRESWAPAPMGRC